jgi:hypothetical protein
MTTYTRLDGGCCASVLAVTNGRVLFDAHWPASKQDTKKFLVTPKGVAHNVVEVSTDYFERKYGVAL